jgi:hypothetical protein
MKERQEFYSSKNSLALTLMPEHCSTAIGKGRKILVTIQFLPLFMHFKTAVHFLKHIEQTEHILVFDAVKNLIRFLARRKNIPFPHNAKVLGNIRLGTLQQFLQFTNRPLPFSQMAQNPQASGMRKRF